VDAVALTTWVPKYCMTRGRMSTTSTVDRASDIAR
jgi:hypothetical protein